MAAVAAVAKRYQMDPDILQEVLSHYTVNNGRMEAFQMGSNDVTLNLAKNPVGANMTLRVMNEMQGG